MWQYLELEKEANTNNRLVAYIEKLERGIFTFNLCIDQKERLIKLEEQYIQTTNARNLLSTYYETVKKHHANFNDKFRLELDCSEEEDLKLIKSLQTEQLPSICKIKLENLP